MQGVNNLGGFDYVQGHTRTINSVIDKKRTKRSSIENELKLRNHLVLISIATKRLSESCRRQDISVDNGKNLC